MITKLQLLKIKPLNEYAQEITDLEEIYVMIY